MRNDVVLADLISGADIPTAFDLVANSSGGFCETAEILGLDRACDFRFSNLSGVDFSGSDLRGYDFRGADLRNSHGVDVLFDDSTNLDGADLQGSCFAAYQREKVVFSSSADAVSMYEALLSGDPFEISFWLHERYGNRPERHPILRRADEATAAVLCQKLMTDDIDLTKRTDLFHFLRAITRNDMELRELILSIFARHINNIPVIEKFVTIAGSLYGNDVNTFNAILLLCKASDPRIRQAAFLAAFRSNLILPHVRDMKTLFLNRENEDIRKGLILQSAISLGRSHVSSINALGQRDGTAIPQSDVLDSSDLLKEDLAIQIASIIQRRDRENADRLSPGKKAVSEAEAEAEAEAEGGLSRHAMSAVIERQEEVLCYAPIIKLIFASENPSRAQAARKRIEARTTRERNAISARISRLSARR